MPGRRLAHNSDEPDLSPARRRAIRTRLLDWYDAGKRELPWRLRPDDGYAQLVAEFMLQQTQVSVVLGYYERFLARFPTLADLARADQQDVLAIWSGLGYYSRARNLHAAARRIAEAHAGHVPQDPAALMALPGIGRYTAGAIASIAFGRRTPVLDGNVTRVLSRLLLIEKPPTSTAAREHLWGVAGRLMPSARCGDFNQALMELGATVCVPTSPRCELCPITSWCLARKRGCAAQIPRPQQRTPVAEVAIVAAAVFCGEQLLFVRRPERGLWGGLWELPSVTLAAREGVAAARRRLRGRLPAGCRLLAGPLPPIQRQLTHRRVTFHIFRGRLGTAGIPAPRTSDERWLLPAAQPRIGLSRASVAILRALNWLPPGA